MLKDDLLAEKRREKLQCFHASDGWCAGFAKRKCLASEKLHVEAGSADIEGTKEEMEAIWERLSSFRAQDIYNVVYEIRHHAVLFRHNASKVKTMDGVEPNNDCM